MTFFKMAILLTETTDIKQSIWWKLYQYFATQKWIKRWYIIITIWIVLIIMIGDLELYFHEDHISAWIIRSAFIFWSIMSLTLLIIARKMRDHFALMAEMKVNSDDNYIYFMHMYNYTKYQ